MVVAGEVYMHEADERNDVGGVVSLPRERPEHDEDTKSVSRCC